MTRSRDTANIIPTVDAKGDLIVATADNTISKLGVGAEGTVLLADPSTATGLAWGAAGGSISVSTTAPADPAEGDLWFNSANATTYIYYDSFWVELSEAKQGADGVDGQDSVVAATAPITYDSGTQTVGIDRSQLASVSGNAIINGGFEIWQRGASFSASGYTADRWTTDLVTGAGTVSQQTFTPGEAPVAGYEGQYFLRRNLTTGAQFSSLIHRIEDVRTFAGQTVTLSFWAKGTNPTGNFSVALLQNFGTGGSAQVNHAVQSLTLTNSWARYTYTFTLGSMSGKTIGANSFLWLSIYQTLANTSASTLDIWGVQLEAGSTATPFRRNANSLQGELAACQRYYVQYGGNNIYEVFGNGHAGSTTTASINIALPVQMRVPPTSITFSTIAVFDFSATLSIVTPTLSGTHLGDKSLIITATGSGLTQFRTYKLGTNNSLSGFIGLSAEL